MLSAVGTRTLNTLHESLWCKRKEDQMPPDDMWTNRPQSKAYGICELMISIYVWCEYISTRLLLSLHANLTLNILIRLHAAELRFPDFRNVIRMSKIVIRSLQTFRFAQKESGLLPCVQVYLRKDGIPRNAYENISIDSGKSSLTRTSVDSAAKYFQTQSHCLAMFVLYMTHSRLLCSPKFLYSIYICNLGHQTKCNDCLPTQTWVRFAQTQSSWNIYSPVVP